MNSCEHPAFGLSAIEVMAFMRNSRPLRIVNHCESNNCEYNNCALNKTQRNLR